jgi:hypothetical protein
VSRIRLWTLRLGIGGALLAYLCAVILAPERAAMALLSDDAYYYFQIARNIVAGYGSTFDGILPTNGYHPLWMLCMVAVYSIGWSNSFAPIAFVMLLLGILTSVTLVVIYRVVDRHLAPGYGWVGVSMLLLPNMLGGMTNGLETGILLLALASLFWVCHRWSIHEPEASAPQRFALGLLLGLVFLCRLDCALLAISAVGLIVLSSLIERRTILEIATEIAPICAGVIVMAAPFFAWNAIGFGHLMPISGSAKSTFPGVRDSLSLHSDQLFGLLLLSAVLGLWGWNTRRDVRNGHRLAEVLRTPLSFLVFACVLHYLHLFLFLSWGTYWWHFAPYGLALSILLARACHGLGERRSGLRSFLNVGLATAVSLASLLAFGAKLENTAHRHGTWLEAARWAKSNSEAGDVFALKDAGLFGYFSDRHVINLDGKANGYRYSDYLSRGEIDQYLREAQTRFVADIDCRYVENLCRIAIPQPRPPAVHLFMPEDREVYRSKPYPARIFQSAGRGDRRFRIWQYPSLGE